VLAMPPGKGLFHRAAVQSGSALRLVTPEAGAATAEKFLKQLGVGKANRATCRRSPGNGSWRPRPQPAATSRR
jgi:carboxylesterase type B